MLNLEGNGKPICMIKRAGDDKDKKQKRPPVICVDDKGESKRGFDEHQLGKEEMFQVIPDPHTERSIVYVTAQSGAGKSYWCYRYATEYQKIFPKNAVYLISSLSDDSSIDRIKGLQRINVKNPEFLKDDLTAEDFADSLLILDDCDCITDKVLKKKIYGIQNACLETGRHFKVSMLITSHVPCAGLETKRTLNECHAIVIFPKSLGNKTLKYLLDGQFGMDKHQIQKVQSLSGRWVCIMRTYPMVVIGEKEIYIK